VGVLKFYTPDIDWSGFHQVNISDDVWADFRDVVLLCHAYVHWKHILSENERFKPAAPLCMESKYMRRKRLDALRREIRSNKNHFNRTAFLAGEKLWSMVAMTSTREDSPDRYLSWALMKAVGAKHILNRMTGHERADFDVLAFETFNGNDVSADIDALSTRWPASAGYQKIL
jgi:hypothetical protein